MIRGKLPKREDHTCRQAGKTLLAWAAQKLLLQYCGYHGCQLAGWQAFFTYLRKPLAIGRSAAPERNRPVGPETGMFSGCTLRSDAGYSLTWPVGRYRGRKGGVARSASRAAMGAHNHPLIELSTSTSLSLTHALARAHLCARARLHACVCLCALICKCVCARARVHAHVRARVCARARAWAHSAHTTHKHTCG